MVVLITWQAVGIKYLSNIRHWNQLRKILRVVRHFLKVWGASQTIFHFIKVAPILHFRWLFAELTNIGSFITLRIILPRRRLLIFLRQFVQSVLSPTEGRIIWEHSVLAFTRFETLTIWTDSLIIFRCPVHTTFTFTLPSYVIGADCTGYYGNLINIWVM